MEKAKDNEGFLPKNLFARQPGFFFQHNYYLVTSTKLPICAILLL
jgi:hypothetical protein